MVNEMQLMCGHGSHSRALEPPASVLSGTVATAAQASYCSSGGGDVSAEGSFDTMSDVAAAPVARETRRAAELSGPGRGGNLHSRPIHHHQQREGGEAGPQAKPAHAPLRSPDKHALRGRLHEMQSRFGRLEEKMLRTSALGDTLCSPDAACACAGAAPGCALCMRGVLNMAAMQGEVEQLEAELREMRGALGFVFGEGAR
jgi:hypothetical protein